MGSVPSHTPEFGQFPSVDDAYDRLVAHLAEDGYALSDGIYSHPSDAGALRIKTYGSDFAVRHSQVHIDPDEDIAAAHRQILADGFGLITVEAPNEIFTIVRPSDVIPGLMLDGMRLGLEAAWDSVPAGQRVILHHVRSSSPTLALYEPVGLWYDTRPTPALRHILEQL